MHSLLFHQEVHIEHLLSKIADNQTLVNEIYSCIAE